MAENVSTLTLSDVDSWTFDLNNEDDLRITHPNNPLQPLSTDDVSPHRLLR